MDRRIFSTRGPEHHILPPVSSGAFQGSSLYSLFLVNDMQISLIVNDLFFIQSIRNSRDKAECDMVVQENGNASPMMVALHLDNGDIDPIATTSPMVCYDSATSAHGTAERTTSSSANNSSDYVPIPIFTSSQYSIHRRKRRRTRSGSKLPNKRPGKAFQPYATIASRRRRHSWCCLQEASRFMDRRDIIAHST